MEQKKQVRYGISDIVVEPNQTPSKYVQVFDENGKLLGEAEVYFIDDEPYEENDEL